jgi:chorismate synthase
MAGNSFGNIFRITTFGESHGSGIGVVVDGCPSMIEIDLPFIQQQLGRRKPGQSTITTSRKEDDELVVMSGIFEGKTTGAPITLFIKNKDQNSDDYAHLKEAFRPNHADFTYESKYGIRDYAGGGRSSARETAARVMSGALAQSILKKENIQITAFVSQVGDVKLKKHYSELNFANIDSTIVRCPDPLISKKMIEKIELVKSEGDTIGGVITCVIQNLPIGLGEPVFDKLHADLAKAMLSINAAKGFDYGDGFDGLEMKGSDYNDVFVADQNNIKKVNTKTNHSGGIQGGITNGQDVYFRVAFKPVSTIMQAQQTIDKNGQQVEISGIGRHDPCVVPRAVPIVESMAALVIIDHLLRFKAYSKQ